MTIQTLSINSNNDIYLDSSGNIAIDNDLNALLDICKNVLQAQLGEMILSQNAGLPNFQAIWNGAPNYAIYSNYMTNALLNINGVTGIQNLSFSNSGSVLSYTVTIQTIFGTGTVNG